MADGSKGSKYLACAPSISWKTAMSLTATRAPSASASTGGKLEISGSVSGTGSMTIAAGATLQLDGSVAAGQTIQDILQDYPSLKDLDIRACLEFAGNLTAMESIEA